MTKGPPRIDDALPVITGNCVIANELWHVTIATIGGEGNLQHQPMSLRSRPKAGSETQIGHIHHYNIIASLKGERDTLSMELGGRSCNKTKHSAGPG